MVALDGAVARRRRRPRLLVILPRQTWEASRPRRDLHRPADRVPVLPQAVPRRPPAGGSTPRRRASTTPTTSTSPTLACPNCGTRGAWTEPRQFSGLLKTYLGVVEDESGLHYLRPETAQGIFLNFANVVTTSRKKPPFGIAQIGKSFRNEITPGNFIFRTREFEQMEMEFFVKPGEDEEWHQYWIDERTRWYVDLGIDPDNLRHFEHPQEKLSPLLQAHRRHRVPLQLRRLGVGRARGHRQPHRLRPARRTPSTPARTCPTSTRPPTSATCPTSSSRRPACSRSLMTFLVDAYTEDEAPNTKGGVDKRTVLRLDPRLAPVKVAVLPL